MQKRIQRFSLMLSAALLIPAGSMALAAGSGHNAVSHQSTVDQSNHWADTPDYSFVRCNHVLPEHSGFTADQYQLSKDVRDQLGTLSGVSRAMLAVSSDGASCFVQVGLKYKNAQLKIPRTFQRVPVITVDDINPILPVSIVEANDHLSDLYMGKLGIQAISIGGAEGALCHLVFVDGKDAVRAQRELPGAFEGYPVRIQTNSASVAAHNLVQTQ